MSKKVGLSSLKVEKHDFYHVLDKIIQRDTDNYGHPPAFHEKSIAFFSREFPAKGGAVEAGGEALSKEGKVHFTIKPSKGIVVSSSKKSGVSDDEKIFTYSAIEAIESVRSGVHFGDFKDLYDLLKLPNSKWAEIIGISERTIQNILKEKRNLDQNKSEKLLSFLLLVEYALAVLGNHNNFVEWLNYKSPVLGGKAPIEYVDTFQGINMLREQLYKIESGNLV